MDIFTCLLQKRNWYFSIMFGILDDFTPLICPFLLETSKWLQFWYHISGITLNHWRCLVYSRLAKMCFGDFVCCPLRPFPQYWQTEPGKHWGVRTKNIAQKVLVSKCFKICLYRPSIWPCIKPYDLLCEMWTSTCLTNFSLNVISNAQYFVNTLVVG